MLLPGPGPHLTHELVSGEAMMSCLLWCLPSSRCVVNLLWWFPGVLRLLSNMQGDELWTFPEMLKIPEVSEKSPLCFWSALGLLSHRLVPQTIRGVFEICPLQDSFVCPCGPTSSLPPALFPGRQTHTLRALASVGGPTQARQEMGGQGEKEGRCLLSPTREQWGLHFSLKVAAAAAGFSYPGAA